MYDFYCIILVTYMHTIFVGKMKWICSVDEIIKYLKTVLHVLKVEYLQILVYSV